MYKLIAIKSTSSGIVLIRPSLIPYIAKDTIVNNGINIFKNTNNLMPV